MTAERIRTIVSSEVRRWVVMDPIIWDECCEAVQATDLEHVLMDALRAALDELEMERAINARLRLGLQRVWAILAEDGKRASARVFRSRHALRDALPEVLS